MKYDDFVKSAKKTLVAAHRGTAGGNIIQNTVAAYQNSLAHGADMVEVDVTMSQDKVFYAFHDGQENLVFGKDINIKKMDSKEIDRLDVINSIGEKVAQKLERIEYVLEKLQGKCYINIDRSWFYWEEFLPFLKQQKSLDRILLKSPVIEDRLALLEQSGLDISYMPIVKSQKDYEILSKYKNIRIEAVEIIFESLDSETVEADFLEKLKKEKKLLWVNSLTLNDSIKLSAGFDDNKAILDGQEENWGKLVDMGFDIIQTDWPLLLKQFLLSR